MAIKDSGSRRNVGGDNMEMIFQALMDVGNINPRLVADLRNDLESLDKTVEMNAQEFTATSKDIKKVKQTIIRLDGALKALQKELPDFKPVQEIIQEVVDAQNLFAKQVYSNADKILENDKAEEERNELLKRLNKISRRKITAEELQMKMRVRMEQQYRRQEMDYMMNMARLRQQRSKLMERNLAGFTRDELKSQGDFLNRQQGSTSAITRNIAGVGRNIRRDIPDSSLSRLRVNALNDSATGNLFQQLAGLQTFQQGGEVRHARQKVERITDIRTTTNPLSRAFKLMDHEIRNGKSRLIIKNIATGIVESLKKQVEGVLIKILNAPFQALGFLFRKSKDFVGDVATGLFYGDNALQKRQEDRAFRDEERKIESQDRRFEMLGVGINDLIDALGKYTSMIDSGGMKGQSINSVEEQMRMAEKQFDLFKMMRGGIGVAGDTAETLGYFQHKEMIDELNDLDEHTQQNTDALKNNTSAAERVWHVPPGGFGAASVGIGGLPAKSSDQPRVRLLGGTTDTKTFDAETGSEIPYSVGGQEREQYIDTFIQNIMMQTQIQMEILDVLKGKSGGTSDEKDGGGKFGIISSILGRFRGAIGMVKGIIPRILNATGIAKLGRTLAPILRSAKSFLPRILGALGLGSRGALLGTLTRVLGPIGAIVGGFMKTADEFKPGDFLGNFMRLTENITTYLPEQIGKGLDAITSLLFGFELKLGELPGKLFDSLNQLGDFLGGKLHELVYGKPTEGVEESFDDRQNRLKEAQEKERHQMYLEKNRREAEEREKMLRELEETRKPINYNVKPSIRDPFSPPPTVAAPSNGVSSTPTDIDPDIVNDKLPIRITSASDSKHRKGSKHYTGNALDLTPVGHGGIPYNGQPLSKQNPAAARAYAKVHRQLEAMGLRVVDEYSQPGKTSKHGTARHIHVEGSQEQINDLLNRAEVIKSNVVPFKGVSSKQKIGEMNVISAQRRVMRSDNPRENNESTIAQQVAMVPNINVPAPNVNINLEKEMDTSYNGYMMFQAMMS